MGVKYGLKNQSYHHSKMNPHNSKLSVFVYGATFYELVAL